MNKERSRSFLGIGTKLPQGPALESRVQNFIKRQQYKTPPADSPNLSLNKSSNALTERSQLTMLEDSTIDISRDTMQASKSSLKELKLFQEMLRSQLHEKSSYSNSMILRKVNQKFEEILSHAKAINAKGKELGKLEARLDEKLKVILEKEKLSKSISHKGVLGVLDLSDTSNSFEGISQIKKKICFDELMYTDYNYEEIQTPGFATKPNIFKNQSELSQLESELRLKSYELSRITESLKIKEQNIAREYANINISKAEIKNREDNLKIEAEKLENRRKKIEIQEKNLENNTKESICRGILDMVISKSLEEIITNEKATFFIFHDKLQKEFEDLTNYEARLSEQFSERKKNLDRKEENLKLEEARVFREIKLLSKNNLDTLLQEKLEDITKKEIKLRTKQLELLEFKEQLNDREEELLEKEAALKFQYSSVYRENSIYERESEIQKRKSELEQFKDSLLLEWISNRSLEEGNYEKGTKKEQEITETWKLLRHKEEILVEKATEVQEFAGLVAGKFSHTRNSSSLDNLLFDSIR